MDYFESRTKMNYGPFLEWKSLRHLGMEAGIWMNDVALELCMHETIINSIVHHGISIEMEKIVCILILWELRQSRYMLIGWFSL